MDLDSNQEILKNNLKPDFFNEFLKTRTAQINKMTIYKYGKSLPMPESQQQPYLQAGIQLTDSIKRYATIALVINPIILEYNKIVEDTYDNHPTDLTQLNEIAMKLMVAYSTTEFSTLRTEIGKLRIRKRIWMEIDVPYRNKLYQSLDQAANILKEAKKMRIRTKRLDAKVNYPYWLW